MYATLTIAVALVVFFLQLTMIGNIIYDGLPEEEYFLPCDEEAVVDEGERRLQAGGKNGGGGDGESCDTHLIFKWSMFGISMPKSGRT